MLKDNPTIVVAIITALVSVFTLVIGKIYESKVQARKIKEAQYIGSLSNLAKYKCNKSNALNSTNEELSIKVQMIYLVGDVRVQKTLQEFINVIKNGGNPELQKFSYGKLIQAMKLDLYGRKYKILPSKYRSIDFIELTIFQ